MGELLFFSLMRYEAESKNVHGTDQSILSKYNQANPKEKTTKNTTVFNDLEIAEEKETVSSCLCCF